MIPLLLAWVACAPPDSCAAFSEAATDCADEAGADATPWAAENVCGDDWSPDAEAAYGAWYRCRTAAYEDGDCSSVEGYDAATAVADECVAP
jgi:hypothetical protein